MLNPQSKDSMEKRVVGESANAWICRTAEVENFGARKLPRVHKLGLHDVRLRAI